MKPARPAREERTEAKSRRKENAFFKALMAVPHLVDLVIMSLSRADY